MRKTQYLAAACVLAASVGVAHAQSLVRIRPAPQAGAPAWMGLGVEFDPYSMPPTDDRWRTIEQRLDTMHPGFFRVMLDATDYCAGFDAKGRPEYAWLPAQTGNAALQARWREVQRVLGYAQSRHVRVLLGQWSPPASLGLTTPADPRWATLQADLAAYLLRQEDDSMITDLISMNEPNGQWMWRHSAPDYAAWIAGVRSLQAALNARGLQQIAIAGPDNSGDTAWFDRTVTQDHKLFGAWESHIYATDAEVLGGLITTQLRAQSQTIAQDDPQGAGKERFLAESGLQTGKIEALDQQPRVHDFDYGVLMADYVAQVADAAWLGADAWDLDDAMHTNGHGGLKIWGFWDSSSDAGMQPRPWFYAWTLLSQALPRGASVEQVSGVPAGLRVAAVRYGPSGESVLLVNESSVAAQVQVDDPRLRGTVEERTYAGSGSAANGGRFTKGSGLRSGVEGSMNVTVAPHSVLVLVTAAPRATTISAAR